ncbi:MAG: UDP-N-acetylglucosamine 1-carboxyvinyltransferase [Bacteroidia bacterium]|jgi:UDP-N-acetylglucosamine 1-carboxyvinyltransferase
MNSNHRDTLLVEGGHPLSGNITPQGAKNEALQVLAAVLLTEEPVTLHRLPDILDVRHLIDLLRGLGVTVEDLGGGSMRFTAKRLDPAYLEGETFRQGGAGLRGSIMLLGPLLARQGWAMAPRPGGDKIGRRRLDTHFTGLQALGATLVPMQNQGMYRVEAPSLQGTRILLDEASVTGTANVIMAACLAKGTTVLYNAACEPYIQQLCRLINAMGGGIDPDSIGSNLLRIEGVDRLHGAEHRLLPDMIEVGSFVGLAAMTRSSIRICDAAPSELGIIPEVFRRMGVQLRIEGNDILVPAQDHYEIEHFMDGSILTVADAPWPGFTPDLLSVVLVMATQAKGSVLIHQKMFESRLFFVDKLIDMGAQIILCDPHRATVIGLDHAYPLKGIRMTSPDIRAGVALLIAALSAKGNSQIDNAFQIDRGYERIDERLTALGARLQRL